MLKKLLVPVIVAVVLAAPALAQEEAGPPKGEVMEVEIAARSLKGNLVGTPTTQKALVYLPASYATEKRRRYPVLYLLHGIFDSGRTWISFTNVPDKLDRLIAEGTIPEVIAVMPDAGNQYGGGYYRNSPVSGNWADYIVKDLVKTIDKRYRTLARAGGRGVAGHSMGGYGAIHLAIDYPGTFSSVYAISPCCLAPVEDLGLGNEAWKRASQITTSEEIQAAMEARDFYAVAVMGFLAAFNPAPDVPPFYVDFPFEIVRGETVIDQSAYAAYAARFPVRRVYGARKALVGLRAFGIEYGISDQFQHIPVATAQFAERLAELRIPYRLDVYDGDHREHVPERMERVILPFVAAPLDRPEEGRRR